MENTSSPDRKQFEEACLAATREAFARHPAVLPEGVTIKSVELEGEFPDTAVNVIYELDSREILGGLRIYDRLASGEYVSSSPEGVASIILTNTEELLY